MTNTFDNKVYEYIKEGGGGSSESLSFDDVYPVGSIVRISTKTPPSQGTWEFTGVYGNVYDDDTSSQVILNTFHFKGKSAIVISRWITNCGTSWAVL